MAVVFKLMAVEAVTARVCMGVVPPMMPPKVAVPAPVLMVRVYAPLIVPETVTVRPVAVMLVAAPRVTLLFMVRLLVETVNPVLLLKVEL